MDRLQFSAVAVRLARTDGARAILGGSGCSRILGGAPRWPLAPGPAASRSCVLVRGAPRTVHGDQRGVWYTSPRRPARSGASPRGMGRSADCSESTALRDAALPPVPTDRCGLL